MSGLFGGGDSASTSTQQTTTSNQDRRLVTDAGALGISGDNANISPIITTTTTTTTNNTDNSVKLDAGAVHDAIDLAKTSTAAAAQGITDAGDVTRNAINRLQSGFADFSAQLAAQSEHFASGLSDNSNLLQQSTKDLFDQASTVVKQTNSQSYGLVGDVASQFLASTLSAVKDLNSAAQNQNESFTSTLADAYLQAKAPDAKLLQTAMIVMGLVVVGVVFFARKH